MLLKVTFLFYLFNFMFLKIELESKISQAEALTTQFNNLQNKELVCNYHVYKIIKFTSLILVFFRVKMLEVNKIIVFPKV